MAANLHSRLASRVLLKIAHRPYRSEHDIYALALRAAMGTVVLGERNAARRRHRDQIAAAQPRIRDAAREGRHLRPPARTERRAAEHRYRQPDVRVFAFLTATECTLYLDTSGDPLFKRGWRLDKGAAPLRENLAAGILRLTGWTPGTPLYDPMCGSGTFLAEAAQVALNIAPGVERRFGFEKLKQYDVEGVAKAEGRRRRRQARRAHIAGRSADFRQRHFRRHARQGAREPRARRFAANSRSSRSTRAT